MTYNNNIPQPNDNPSDSQPQLLGNFSVLFTDLNRNHVSLLDSTNGGRHNIVELKEQSVSPPLAGATFATLYAKNDAGVQNLYFKNQTQDIKLTGASSATGNGFIIIGNIQMQWGLASVAHNGFVNFPTPFSGSAFNVVAIQAGLPPNSPSIVSVQGLSNVNFQVAYFPTTLGSINIYWHAIGPA